MTLITAISSLALVLSGGNTSSIQQGGNLRQNSDDSLRNLERALATYLNGDEMKSILSPGEFNEWKLNLKVGQVVISEARSDAFDPALEIVDPSDHDQVLAKNDDRFPGDQRPLLLWRCVKDGVYGLRARCFHDKSGGQVFVRYRTFESIDLSLGKSVEQEVDANNQFLLKVPMRAGQQKRIENSGDPKDMGFRTVAVIAPGGLPDIDLAREISPLTRSFLAPVSGDYYVVAEPYGSNKPRATIRAATTDVVAQKMERPNGTASVSPVTNAAQLWELDVRAGELLEVSAPELSLNPRFVLAEEPDISKFSLDKDETNPFYPVPKDKAPADRGPAFDIFPARVRDGRVFVFRARRDTKLWLAADGQGKPNSQYALLVRPAAADFTAEKENQSRLRIGNYDYWAFEAQAGDVMSLSTKAAGFTEELRVRDPDLDEIRHFTAGVDQASDDWRMIVQKPGRYLVSVSAMGDGGSGDYSVSRKVLHAKIFGKGTPAEGDLDAGQIQIWKFTAKPGEPLFIRWRSTGAGYGVAIYDDKGNPNDLQRQAVDGGLKVGILSVARPQTYVIVLTGSAKAHYSIELGDIPRGKPGP